MTARTTTWRSKAVLPVLVSSPTAQVLDTLEGALPTEFRESTNLQDWVLSGFARGLITVAEQYLALRELAVYAPLPTPA